MVLGKGGGNNGKGGDGFIDRSKVRILLCDSDSKRLDEAFTLLCKCSYQGIHICTSYVCVFVIEFHNIFALDRVRKFD